MAQLREKQYLRQKELEERSEDDENKEDESAVKSRPMSRYVRSAACRSAYGKSAGSSAEQEHLPAIE